jgi:acetate kinase
MRELLRAEQAGDEAAALAVEMFVRRAAGGIAAAAASLDAIDGIVFTGGIGENAATVRARIAARLGVLGVEVPTADDPGGDAVLIRRGPAVLRVAAREDVVIATATARIVAEAPDP